MKKQKKSKVTDRWIAVFSAIAMTASAFAGLITTAMAADNGITGSYDYDAQKFEWKVVEDTSGKGTFTTDTDDAYADLTVQSDNASNKLIASDNAVYFYRPSTAKGGDNNNVGYLKITPAVDGRISFGVYMTRTYGNGTDYHGNFRVAEADNFEDIFSDFDGIYFDNQDLGAPKADPINTTYTSPELSAGKTYIIYTWAYYNNRIDIKLSNLAFEPTTPVEKPDTTPDPDATATPEPTETPEPTATPEPTPTPVPQMIFDIDFNDKSVTANIGAATEGTNSGTYAESYDGTMAYKFNTSYFKPTKEDGTPLLTGLEEFTVSYWANMGTSLGWSFFAAPNTTKQTNKYETYIGILDNNTSITVERYNNSGSRPSNANKSGLSDGWKHIVMVQSTDKSALYVDGELVSSVSSSYSVSSILGSASVIQVGKGNWSSGEYASGLIDNYHIYNYALSDDEIAELHTAELPVPAVIWDTGVDSARTGKGDAASGTLRFLASVSNANGYDISNGEYGFVFVNFETGIVLNNHMGETEIPAFTGESDSTITVKKIADSGLAENKTFYVDITGIPLSASKIGVYAVPYVVVGDGTVMYGKPFTAKKFNWITE